MWRSIRWTYAAFLYPRVAAPELIKFVTAQSRERSTMDFIAENGWELDGVDTGIENSIPPQQYAKLLQQGYHLYQTVEIPVTASSVRLAVRDTQSNRIGSLEIPLPLAKPSSGVYDYGCFDRLLGSPASAENQ